MDYLMRQTFKCCLNTHIFMQHVSTAPTLPPVTDTDILCLHIIMIKNIFHPLSSVETIFKQVVMLWTLYNKIVGFILES